MSAAVAVPGAERWVRGPTAAATPSPPQAVVPGGLPITWMGAHGGAGATSLARALGGADPGVRWPDVRRGEPRQVLAVARTHSAGIQAASAVLDAMRLGNHPEGVHLLGLVLVADAPGRLPVKLAHRVRILGSAARVHRVPWIPSWRVGGRTAHLPREVLALADLVNGAS
ncbi:DUF6668 family protein [Streptomyces antibioticus]|uniref:DUF6668 family protein n=1 Tax=Streptomyces antibioticus TaxID=1890 RepID=UPI00371285E0